MSDQSKQPNLGQESRRSILASVIATLLLAAVEVYFFVPAISYDGTIIPLAAQNPQNPYTLDFLFPSTIGFFVLYCLIPIIFCSFSSVLLHPKKLVNPIIVQGGVMTVAIVALILRMALVNPIFAPTPLLMGLSFAVIALSTMVVLVIGLFQWIFVTWMIRMNYESSSEKAFVVDLKTKAILHKLGSSFLDDHNFSRKCDLGDIWRLERSDGNFRYLLIEIGPHPDDGAKSILATVAYEIRRNRIFESRSASNLRDIIVGDIEKRLGLEFAEKATDLTDPVSRLAIDNVEDLGRSRIEVTWDFLRGISKFYQAAIGLTASLLAALSVVYFYFSQNINLSSDSYIVTSVALFIALIVEIGLPLREELNKKKREEIEF